HRQHACVDGDFIGTVLDWRALWDWRTACDPVKDFRQRIPEVTERRKNRELVRQHVRPHPLKSLTMRKQRLEGGHRNYLVFAFLAEYVQKHRVRWSAVSVPVKVHDVV